MTDKSHRSYPHIINSTPIERKMLEMLVCPFSKTTLIYKPLEQELISPAARLAFPIRDGIPILLSEEARILDEDEINSLK